MPFLSATELARGVLPSLRTDKQPIGIGKEFKDRSWCHSRQSFLAFIRRCLAKLAFCVILCYGQTQLPHKGVLLPTVTTPKIKLMAYPMLEKCVSFNAQPANRIALCLCSTLLGHCNSTEKRYKQSLPPKSPWQPLLSFLQLSTR